MTRIQELENALALNHINRNFGKALEEVQASFDIALKKPLNTLKYESHTFKINGLRDFKIPLVYNDDIIHRLETNFKDKLINGVMAEEDVNYLIVNLSDQFLSNYRNALVSDIDYSDKLKRTLEDFDFIIKARNARYFREKKAKIAEELEKTKKRQIQINKVKLIEQYLPETLVALQKKIKSSLLIPEQKVFNLKIDDLETKETPIFYTTDLDLIVEFHEYSRWGKLICDDDLDNFARDFAVMALHRQFHVNQLPIANIDNYIVQRLDHVNIIKNYSFKRLYDDCFDRVKNRFNSVFNVIANDKIEFKEKEKQLLISIKQKDFLKAKLKGMSKYCIHMPYLGNKKDFQLEELLSQIKIDLQICKNLSNSSSFNADALEEVNTKINLLKTQKSRTQKALYKIRPQKIFEEVVLPRSEFSKKFDLSEVPNLEIYALCAEYNC